MKISKNKRVYAVMLALVLLVAVAALIHGCGISSYEGKKLASISIDPVNNTTTAGSVTIAAQTVQQFKATGHYSDSSTVDVTSSMTWATSNASIATVSGAGLAAAVASSGTCTITATGQGMTGATQLNIKNLPLQSITVTPGPTATTNKAMTLQFTAAGLFTDGTDTISSEDISTLVSWNSSTTSVATIGGNTGLATGVSAGTTDITAQLNGITSSATTLTVSNLAVKSIAITASGIAQVTKPPVQLTATATLSDNSTLDMTSQVTWASENPGTATVDGTGLLTPLMAGNATITASAGGVTGTLQVTVFAAPGH